MKLLVIDTETGGLDPNECSLLTYAAVVWEDGKVGETLGPIYVQEPTLHVTLEAMRVNKIDLCDTSLPWAPVADGSATLPLKRFAAKHFKGSEGFMPCAGHNVGFDLRFFARLYGLAHNGRMPFDHRALCTIAILRFLVATGHVDEQKLGTYKLQSAMDYFGIVGVDGSTVQRHGCLEDALAAAHLLTRLWEMVGPRMGAVAGAA